MASVPEEGRWDLMTVPGTVPDRNESLRPLLLEGSQCQELPLRARDCAHRVSRWPW